MSLTNKERGRLDRLKDRCHVLQARLDANTAGKQDWEQELSALSWAVAKIEAQSVPEALHSGSTPRTDAAAKWDHEHYVDERGRVASVQVVRAEFARQLERELSARPETLTFEQVRDAIVQRMQGHTISAHHGPAWANFMFLLGDVKASECALP